MSAATSWVYQAPYRPASHPDQCYYRVGSVGHEMFVPGADSATPEITVFRWARESRVDITVNFGKARVQMQLDRESLTALRDAINDVLQDGEAVEAERERRESFERIQDEMRDAHELGGTGCYYAHPDVHYVHPDRVAEKVRELQAAGTPRYIVLPEPTFESVASA